MNSKLVIAVLNSFFNYYTFQIHFSTHEMTAWNALILRTCLMYFRSVFFVRPLRRRIFRDILYNWRMCWSGCSWTCRKVWSWSRARSRRTSTRCQGGWWTWNLSYCFHFAWLGTFLRITFSFYGVGFVFIVHNLGIWNVFLKLPFQKVYF